MAVAVVVAAAGVGGTLALRDDDPSPRPEREVATGSGSAAGPGGAARLADDDLDAVADLARRALKGDARPSRRGETALASERPVFAVVRVAGERVGSDWAVGASAADNVAAGVAAAAGQASAEERSAIDVVELAIAHSFRSLELKGGGGMPANVHRGVRGVELRFGDEVGRYAPTHMLATNRDFDEILDDFRSAHGVSDDEVGEVTARTFEADQLLVPVDPSKPPVRMFRGNAVVDVGDVDGAAVERAADLMTTWLLENVAGDGRMTYTWWPSSGTESTSNNMIRQWMATVALMRGIDGDAARREVALRNLRYNLATFYREEGGLGVIDFDGEVKLGAVALAALAIVESPDRAQFAAQENALLRTIDRLWHEDGRFDTFLRPESRRGENANFYPGETLLLWATLWRESRDPALLDRYMRSFEWYRAWHLDEKNRNPAFVPWHTQAHVMVWRETRDPKLAAFVVEMNDWLLAMQQWDGVQYPDLAGRFYDPDRSHFGPPHASSTGVYLEGLIDAYALAAGTDDDARAERYRQVIVRGLRSVLQLQLADDVDLYYVSQRDRVRGGVRTEVYDNSIRVDNVQHNLMALRKILATFSPADFRS
ncbi:MAG TPA: hypothetical protein VF230_16970 [Acidimicrobiales bacterium]